MPSESHNESLELLTVAETASFIRISKSLTYALVETGKLPASRLGKGRGAIRILKSDALTYIEQNRIPVSGGAEIPRPRRRETLKHIRL